MKPGEREGKEGRSRRPRRRPPSRAAPKPRPRRGARARPAPTRRAGASRRRAGRSPSRPSRTTIQYRSVGPGGFIRQGPGDQQAPIPPAPPRRLVPAKPSAEVADKTGLLDLNDRICKWPMGHPGEPDFHFCGKPANPGFPYCVEHCGVAYQAQLPRRDRRPPPPLPFGGPAGPLVEPAIEPDEVRLPSVLAR